MLNRTYKLLVDGSSAAFRCHVRALELLEGFHDLHHVDRRCEQILIQSANLRFLAALALILLSQFLKKASVSKTVRRTLLAEAFK